MLDSFQSQTKRPFLSVLQFSSFSDHLNKCLPHQEVHHQRVTPSPPFFQRLTLTSVRLSLRVFRLQTCAILRDMCVVFAGPFPAGFSLKEVRRLFRCCGPVHNIRMLNTAVRVRLTFSMIHLTPVNQCFSAVSTGNGWKREVTSAGKFSDRLWSPGSRRDRV